MAIVRDAAAPELSLPGVGEKTADRSPSRYLRRYGPIS